MMRAKLKRGVLLVLQAWDGLPMVEASLLQAVRLHARPAEPTDGDLVEALKDCEAEGYVQGATDAFTQERSWTLTEKGIHKARQLR